MSLQTPPKHKTGLPGYNLLPLDDQLPTTRPPRYFDPDLPPATRMNYPNAPVASCSLTPAVISLFALGTMLLGFSWHRGFLLGQLLACFAVPLALVGLFKGGARKLIMLTTMIGMLYAGTALPGILAPLLEPVVESSATLMSYVLSGVIGVMALLVARSIGKRVRQRMENEPILSMVDRAAGVTIGAAEGLLLVLVLCWVCTLLEPQAQRLRDMGGVPIDSIRHQFAGQVLRISQEASSEPLGEWMRATNPIEKIPVLKQAIDGLNQTGELNIEGINPELLRSARQLFDSQGAGRPTDLNALLDQYRNAATQQGTPPAAR